jgi:hypothetical protein
MTTWRPPLIVIYLLGLLACSRTAVAQPGSSRPDSAAVSQPAVEGGDEDQGEGDSADAAARPLLVVLLNGSIVQGRVERSVDRLVVSNGPWYVVRVPSADVDFVAPDLAAAYRIKRSRLGERDFSRHLQLAQWCLRHGAPAQAADELLHLRRLDPHHSAVQTLQQQLLRSVAADATPADSTDPPPTRAVNARPAQASVPASAPADADEPMPEVAAAAVSQFTRSIQPLLLNRCGQAACHGIASRNGFSLERLRAGGAARKEVTWRNLRAALAQVDPAHVAESPLLDRALKPHGTSQRPPFGPHEMRQYQRLLDWVDKMTAADAEGDSVPATSPMARRPPVVTAETEADAADVSAATGPEPLPTSLMAQPLVVDPYDPAPFNARLTKDPEASADILR